MLFATQLRLGLKDLTFHKVTDAYSVHRVIYSLFDDYRNSEEKKLSKSSGFLFTELKQRNLFREFLIISDREPKQLDFKDSSLLTRTVPEPFLRFKHYRFNVVINPTKRDPSSGNLIPICGRSEISDWFCDKSAKTWGFLVNEINVGETNVLKFNGKNNRKIVIFQASLSGSLTVIDQSSFIKAFSNGIGRGHAFGCGLLQITPIFD